MLSRRRRHWLIGDGTVRFFGDIGYKHRFWALRGFTFFLTPRCPLARFDSQRKEDKNVVAQPLDIG